jgi:hypothetical protein
MYIYIYNYEYVYMYIHIQYIYICIYMHINIGIHFIERQNRMYIVALSMGIVLALSAILMILEVFKNEFYSTNNESDKKMPFPPPFDVLCSSEYL